MKNFTEDNDLKMFQIIDANLDRAREGLRVLEDWARFAIRRKDLVEKIKDFRQILGKHHLKVYKQARNVIKDECIGLSHPEQGHRNNAESIISSNAARVQEALRVIEEFSRIHNPTLCESASKIRYEVYDIEIKLLSLISYSSFKNILIKNNLYFITSDTEDIVEKTKKVLEGGVKIVQFRCKEGNDADNLKKALNIRELCNNFNALFIVNDRIDIAIASSADGVHLGQNDIPISVARNIFGYSKIIGISANTTCDINKALEGGCDYLGIGPVFATSTKKEKSPLGIELLKAITKDIAIPWFAIGGIKYENISLLREYNISKVAIITELTNSENPKEKAMMLIKNLNNEN